MSFDKCPVCGYHESISAQLNAHVMNTFKNQFGGVAVFNKANNVEEFSTTDAKTGQTHNWKKLVESRGSSITALEQPVAEAAKGTAPIAPIIPAIVPKPATPIKEGLFEDDGAAPVSKEEPPKSLEGKSPVVSTFGGPPTSPQPVFKLNPTKTT